jgi:soluble lytic murein transglycosylase-like protein
VAALGLFMLFAVFGAVRAEVYVYEMPDGTRVITDHPINAKHSRVVRVAPDVKGAGKLAAQKNSPVFREDAATYDRLIRRYADEYGVEFALVKAIMTVESAFNPYAVSNKGARGLMQMMPSTAARYGVTDIYNPVENVRAAAQHLKYLFDTFGNKPILVIAAYNAGENAVKQYRGIPPYEETQNYVKKVLSYQRQYRPKYRYITIATNPSDGG